MRARQTDAPVVHAKAVKRRIEAHLRWLRKELEWVTGELVRAVKESLVWKERAALLMSVPGVGPTLSAILLAELPELEYLYRRRLASLVGLEHRERGFQGHPRGHGPPVALDRLEELALGAPVAEVPRGKPSHEMRALSASW